MKRLGLSVQDSLTSGLGPRGSDLNQDGTDDVMVLDLQADITTKL